MYKIINKGLFCATLKDTSKKKVLGVTGWRYPRLIVSLDTCEKLTKKVSNEA